MVASRLFSRSVLGRRLYSTEHNMAFTFASPVSVFYKDANVKQIDVPTLTGDLGVLKDHVPLLAVLKPGVMSVHEDAGVKKFFVSSGSLTINEDSSVQILAEEACPLEHLDAQLVRDGSSKAAQDLLTANSEASKAEAQIALECYEALHKAVDMK